MNREHFDWDARILLTGKRRLTSSGAERQRRGPLLLCCNGASRVCEESLVLPDDDIPVRTGFFSDALRVLISHPDVQCRTQSPGFWPTEALPSTARFLKEEYIHVCRPD